MRTEVVIGKIKEVQAAAALQSLTNPNGKEAFDYGTACGIIRGLELALNVIVNDAEEAKKDGGQFNG